MAYQFEGRFRETERRTGFGSQSDSYKETEGASSDAGQLLQTLDRDLISFRGCIDSIESQFDSHENRREIRRMRSELKKKITSAESNLKQQKSKRSGPEKIQFERLSKQLDSHITTFENLLQKEKKAVQAHPNPPEDSRLDTVDHADQKFPAQTQAQVHMTALEDREHEAEELGELEMDIRDLHGIHQELAGMVGEQGEEIDRIDQNVGVAQTRVEHGAKQIEKAVVLKRRSRKLQCCIFVCVGSIVLAILIVVVILIAVLVTQLSD